MKELEQLHLQNLKVHDLTKEDIKLHNEARASFKNTQFGAQKKLLIGVKKDEPRNRVRIGTTQNLASFPEVMKSIKNLKGPVSIIDSDEEGENMASEW